MDAYALEKDDKYTKVIRNFASYRYMYSCCNNSVMS